MGKFDGYLICTDLDGTFSVGHDICGENLKYVKYFQENGGLFTVTTGRLPEHIKNFEDFEPSCPVVAHNGAVIYDLKTDEILYKKALPDTIFEVIDYASKCEFVGDMWVNGLKYTAKVADIDPKNFNDEIIKLVIAFANTEENVEKTINLRDHLAEKYGNKFSVFLGWKFGIEILPKGANKGTAVSRLREFLGDKVKTVICVGDSESDTFMFETADIGYAVLNATEETKAKADRVTVHFKEGAIAEIIKDIEKELK